MSIHLLTTSCNIQCKGPDVVLFQSSIEPPYGNEDLLVYEYHRFENDYRDTIELELYRRDTVFIETSLGENSCTEFREAYFTQFIYDYTTMQIQHYVLAGNGGGNSNFLSFDIGPHGNKSILRPKEYEFDASAEAQVFELDNGTEVLYRSDSGIVWMLNDQIEMKRIK